MTTEEEKGVLKPSLLPLLAAVEVLEFASGGLLARWRVRNAACCTGAGRASRASRRGEHTAHVTSALMRLHFARPSWRHLDSTRCIDWQRPWALTGSRALAQGGLGVAQGGDTLPAAANLGIGCSHLSAGSAQGDGQHDGNAGGVCRDV